MRLAIVVEGRTEEEFVNGLVAPELRCLGITSQPIVLGGNVSIDRVAAEMADLSWDFESVTSLVDYYGFKDKRHHTPEALQNSIDNRTRMMIGRKYNQYRIFSYVQRHELEGLLFSDTNAFDRLFGRNKEYGMRLKDIRSLFHTPEDINDSSETAPSKRIASVIPRYDKVLDGPLVAMETGLKAIRLECPRFDAWISHLESQAGTD